MMAALPIEILGVRRIESATIGTAIVSDADGTTS
jgi:hypothetical protein